jgi:2-polyprenyl-3-methyl-5-hydroxy-6-metoxy-1,4-benzoquinol methylase
MRLAVLPFALLFGVICFGQINGEAAYAEFLQWQKLPENAGLKWEAATAKYAAKLKAAGVSDVAKVLRIIEARDEATLYDPAYSGTPKFQTGPSALLVEAVKNRKPGKALDVAMGQGRNSIFLARQGWDVTGFDVSKVGLAEARKLADAAGVSIRTVLSSDEEFGKAQWDLIAIVYPIEKRSVYRVREALKPDGIVVVECTHKEPGKGAPFEYETNELLKIFDGFRILKYEDALGMHEWMRKELRLVRVIAQKQ